MVLLEESPLNTITASVYDTPEQQPPAASPSQSSPRHLSRSLPWTCARGPRGEGEGEVGSDQSAAISLKKQLVRCIEAAAGCDTWIRTPLVIDCTAVLSLSLSSPFLLQIKPVFTLHLCGTGMEVDMKRREMSLQTSIPTFQAHRNN